MQRSPYLEPEDLVHTSPEHRDCPDEPTKEPADIAATCGFSI